MVTVTGEPASDLGGRYRIERELGRGGMATVFLATDTSVGRRVAIKVLHPDLAAAVGAERFHREIHIASTLTHPNILPVYDSGQMNGGLFYVMPVVEGESLRDRLDRERQLPLDDAIRITCEVASALEYAHSKGIVHRDIKPENILLEEGHAVVADFGIARATSSLGDGPALTKTGMSLGTPAYMSPEQALADKSLDGRSDQYSLACVTYEMLTGEPPFTSASVQGLIAKHLATPVPEITTVRPSVTDEVQDVILRALEKVPADRFPRRTRQRARSPIAWPARHRSGAHARRGPCARCAMNGGAGSASSVVSSRSGSSRCSRSAAHCSRGSGRGGTWSNRLATRTRNAWPCCTSRI
jgi:serine/threonine-protein kinase